MLPPRRKLPWWLREQPREIQVSVNYEDCTYLMGVGEELNSCSQNADLWTLSSSTLRKMVFFHIFHRFPVCSCLLLIIEGFKWCSTFIFKNSRCPSRLSEWKSCEIPLSEVTRRWDGKPPDRARAAWSAVPGVQDVAQGWALPGGSARSASLHKQEGASGL